MRSIPPLPFLGVLVSACLVGAAGKLPALTVERWVNSTPLTAEALRGKVVLVDIWEYTCINWIRTAPFVKAWHRDYAALGLVVVGLHAPEFEFGRRADNIDRGIRDVRVVEGARLESEAGQRCRATLQRVNAYAINDLTFQAYHSVCVAKPRCSSRF